MNTGEKIALAVGLYWLYANGYLNGLLQSLQSALQGTINVTNPASAGYNSEGTKPLYGSPPGPPTFPAPANPLFEVAPPTQNSLIPVLPGGWSFQLGGTPSPALGTPGNPVGIYGAEPAPGTQTYPGGINSGGPSGFGRGGSPFQGKPFLF